MFVVHVPHISIYLQGPRSFGLGVVVDVVVKSIGLSKEAATVGAKMHGCISSKAKEGTSNLCTSGGSSIPTHLGKELEACGFLGKDSKIGLSFRHTTLSIHLSIGMPCPCPSEAVVWLGRVDKAAI